MPSPLHNDEALLQQIRSGSGEAFEIIYDRFYVSLFYFSRRFVKDLQAAEDITTEIFLKLWNKRSGFDSMPAIQSFLYVAAKNACLNHIRNDQRRQISLRDLAYLQSADSAIIMEKEDITSAVYRYIYDEIEKLPPQLKKVFIMSYTEGLSNEEIALRLNINNQSVRNHKARALKLLRLAFTGMDINMGLFFLAIFSRT